MVAPAVGQGPMAGYAWRENSAVRGSVQPDIDWPTSSTTQQRNRRSLRGLRLKPVTMRRAASAECCVAIIVLQSIGCDRRTTPSIGTSERCAHAPMTDQNQVCLRLRKMSLMRYHDAQSIQLDDDAAGVAANSAITVAMECKIKLLSKSYASW